MHGAPLISWLLVAVCGAAGGHAVLRLRTGGERRWLAGGEALMGLGMVAMAVPPAVWDPRPWGPALVAVVFALLFVATTARALRGLAGPTATRWRRCSPDVHHGVGALAMVYMALAMAGDQPHAEHGHATAGSGTPLLSGALLTYFALHVTRCGARLAPPPWSTASGAGPPSSAVEPGGWAHRPEVTTAAQVAMSLGMFAMLLTA